MPKQKRDKGGRKRPQISPFSTPEALGFMGGVLILFFAAALLSSLIRDVVWRLNLKHNFVEGRARVEKTEVIHRSNAYELEITYHLEKDGVSYRRVTSLEVDGSLPTLAEIEVRRAKYVPGELHPCWYRERDPGNTTVLLPDGLNFDLALSRWWVPLPFALCGGAICRWLWRRRAARER